jgi:hypothetical protein
MVHGQLNWSLTMSWMLSMTNFNGRHLLVTPLKMLAAINLYLVMPDTTLSMLTSMQQT